MSLRAKELAEVGEEISRALGGRSVQKVVQPDARTIALGFPHLWLVVSVDARHGRVHLTDDKPAGTGEAATAFCMLLRKHLVGARLGEVTVVPGERACELARSDDADALQREADLLLAHLADVPRGASEVTLPDDFAGGVPRAIR